MLSQEEHQMLSRVERQEVVTLDMETLIIEDENMDKETPPVLIQEGKEGHLSQLYEDTVLDGQILSSRLIKVLEIVAPSPRVVRVGIRDHQLRQVEDHFQLDPLILPDHSREPGSRTVLQEGSAGTLIRTYQDSFVHGDQVEEMLLEEEVITPAVREVVLIGQPELPQQVVSTYQKTLPLPFERELILDPLLPEGQEILMRPGQDGVVIESYEEIRQGEEVKQTLLSREERVSPINELVRVGTGQAGEPEPQPAPGEDLSSPEPEPLALTSEEELTEEVVHHIRIPEDLLSHFKADLETDSLEQEASPEVPAKEEDHFFADGALTLMSALGLANLKGKH